MQAHQLLHKLHRLAQGQSETAKNLGHPLGPKGLVAVKGPALHGVKPLGARLGNVVQKSRPPEPQIAPGVGHVVQHAKGVFKVVFMALVAASFHALQGRHFGKEQGQQTRSVHELKAVRRLGREHNFVPLFGNAFPRKNLHAIGVAAYGLKGFGFDVEIELGGKAHGPQHAQGVVAKRNIGVEGGAQNAVAQVLQALKRVYHRAVGGFVEADGQGVDGKIASLLVVVKGAVFHNGLARIAAIRLLSRAHHLNFGVVIAKTGRAKVLELGNGGQNALFLCNVRTNLPGKFQAVAHHHAVYVGRGTVEQQVAHIAAHHIHFGMVRLGRLAQTLKNGMGQFIAQIHTLSLKIH